MKTMSNCIICLMFDKIFNENNLEPKKECSEAVSVSADVWTTDLSLNAFQTLTASCTPWRHLFPFWCFCLSPPLCQAGSSSHSGSLPSMFWDLVCHLVDISLKNGSQKPDILIMQNGSSLPLQLFLFVMTMLVVKFQWNYRQP